MNPNNVIALIGGTGAEGIGLALRFAAAGRQVIIGSRSMDRADESAQKVRDLVAGAAITGAENSVAAQAATTIVLTLPFEGQVPALEVLRTPAAGKVVVTAVVPMRFSKGSVSMIVVPEGSAAEQAARLLPESRVIAAFHHLSAQKLMTLGKEVPADVVVVGDDRAAKDEAFALVNTIQGCRPVDGGPLSNARYVEELTALLVGINRIYKIQSSIKIMGV